ncbi:phage tail assembly protein [Segniliparus rugosus]|uniref:Tail assembly chaperone n=1 Tax=Segniliparus rugosus (strain ATCC BAA-974 / DSM 45345 / CCUG 50838 / CIP 108380 / JCM 13579 / CDC 945) TaxID=679197 RepID=E5XRS7_SEGRC|nr:phage tail assembly protein [Segniliparus rugosus]EFV12942.1 hypothetical protein HMPREF9336_02199 [Segniliparus rugosus ATCC BAA-974]
MSNVYTLDTLREELEAKYAPVRLRLPGESDPIVLKGLLRLGKKDRDEVLRLINALEDSDADEGASLDAAALDKQFETVVSVLTIVSGRHKTLAKALDDDIALALRVFELWMEGTQPGEA